MAEIPEIEIDRIKQSVDLAALVRSKGIALKKHTTKDYIGLCPFHDDSNTPNLIVTPSKGLFHCMCCSRYYFLPFRRRTYDLRVLQRIVRCTNQGGPSTLVKWTFQFMVDF